MVGVSVNASASEVQVTGFARRVLEALQRHRVQPKWLDVEITEEAMLADCAVAVAELLQLRAAGIAAQVDDFGTGYASMSCLTDFPIAGLKIDNSMMHGIEHDATRREVINGIARSIGMKVVAEGIETEGQERIARAMQVDAMQGFR